MSPAIPRRKRSSGRKKKMNPLAISAVVIVVTVFIVYYAFNQGLPFLPKYTMYALVNNNVNVRKGSPVRIAGINVGAVESTSPDGQLTKIKFTMNSNGLPIHADATMRIRDRLFLEGGYYLDISPGSPSSPTVGKGFTFQPSHTSSPVQFYKVLSTFTAPARQSLEQQLQTFNQGFSPQMGDAESDSGAGGLKEAIPQLTPVLKDVSWISQALTGTRAGDVHTFLTSSSQFFTTLNDNGTTLNSLITGLNRTTTALAATDSSLAQTISGIDQTVRVAPPALTAIDNSLPPTVRLAKTLTPSLKLAPPLLTKLSGTVTQLINIVKPAKRAGLVKALNTTFTTFPAVLTQLGTMFPVTQSVTSCLSQKVVPLLNSTVQDGALSNGQPVWKEFLHFLPNVAGASGNFDADGHYTRVVLGAGSNSVTGGYTDALVSGLNQIVDGATNLIGISPGGSTPSGAAPQWVGTLTASDFRPDVNCTSQPIPALTPTATGSQVAQSDVHRLNVSGTPSTTKAATAHVLAEAEGKK